MILIFILQITDCFIVRSVIEGLINIPKSYIIDSDYKFIATNQDEYQKNDNYKFEGYFLLKILKINKIVEKY